MLNFTIFRFHFSISNTAFYIFTTTSTSNRRVQAPDKSGQSEITGSKLPIKAERTKSNLAKTNEKTNDSYPNSNATTEEKTKRNKRIGRSLSKKPRTLSSSLYEDALSKSDNNNVNVSSNDSDQISENDRGRDRNVKNKIRTKEDERVAAKRRYNRLRNADKRRNATAEQKNDANIAAKNSMTDLRQNMTDEQRNEVRISNQNRMTDLRQNMTDEQRNEVRISNQNRMTDLRQNMTEEQKLDTRNADQRRKRQYRQKISEDERGNEKNLNAVRQAIKRIEDREKDGPMYLYAANSENVEKYNIGEMNVKCKHCPALHFPEEHVKSSGKEVNEFSSCCNYGKLAILEEFIDDYPDKLKEYFFSKSKEHKKFMSNIRKYNSSFSCASLACSRFSFQNSGPPCYKIQGQIMYKFNQTAQPLFDLPTNGQLYFLDTEEAIEARAKNVDKSDIDILKNLEMIIRENYPFAESYKLMREVYEEQMELAGLDTNNEPEVKLLFSLKKGFDKRCYNLPRSNEVCAILVCNADGEVEPANIVVKLKGAKELTNIYPLDPTVELMTYPLLYPNKSKGWHFSIKDQIDKKITLCDFVKYRLHFRDDEKFLPHHYSGKLFQQWCVDQCAKIEWDRLNFIRKNQSKICRSNYKNLQDYFDKKDEDDNTEIKKVILPKSFIGSPRNMHDNFMDAMAIVGLTGKPDIFLTMTCNPNDPDVLKCLKDDQTPSDRPDIVARVFKLQVDQLLYEITKGHIFGKVVGEVWVIEYQKRGLPHTHLLITLHKKDKWRTRNDIDRFISAEIPNNESDPLLYELVTKLMMHGPCGTDFPDSACWDKKKNKCTKKFPHKFNEETKMNENGYPQYKRSNNGRYVWRKNTRLTNQNVVPYNAYCMKRFSAHINVEKVSDIKAVKYLYKYIYKPYDSVTISAVSETSDGEKKILKYDEVSNYLDARYIGPCEACWRILKYPLQGKSHSVELLDMHLENEQNIRYDLDADEEILQESMNKDTKLTAYFKFMENNKDDDKIKTFKYTDMPTLCTWNNKESIWKYPRRNHFNSIGRLVSVSPRESEKYHLRLLLLNFPGKSFIDMRTVDTVVYDTYKQACLARGLTQNDDEWKQCLREASLFKFPDGLRNLFVTILIHCNPKYPGALWDQFKDDLSEDLKRNNSPDIAYMKTLSLINEKLNYHEKSITDFPDLPKINLKEFNLGEREIYDPIEEKNIADKMIEIMNDDQRAIINDIEKIMNGEKIDNLNCMFIDGPGGTGKSFLLTSLYHLARSKGKQICNMAYSGIASCLLKNGRTTHNRFKLPLNLNHNSISGIPSNTKDADELKNTDIFVLDEASMAPKFVLMAFDKKLKEIMRNDEPFGGKVFILAGDFRQCLPIKKNATETEIFDLMIKRSPLWKLFTKKYLTKNMRADPNEKRFAEELLAIGNGTANIDDYIKIPDYCITEGNLVSEIYGEIFAQKKYAELKNVMIVSPYNSVVDKYNNEALAIFPGEQISYKSIDEADYKSDFPITTEILNSFNSPNFPKHNLELKKDCVVSLLRNLNVKQGLCNGTRLQIIEPKNHVLRCLILNGDHMGEEAFIPRITLLEEDEFPVSLKRHQFPIKLAFASTINKAQGQTFSKIGIDLIEQVFSHGQTYVALSRVKNWESIKIKLCEKNVEKKILNIVWPEVLI